MTSERNVLYVTIGDGEAVYEDGLEAIRTLEDDGPVGGLRGSRSRRKNS